MTKQEKLNSDLLTSIEECNLIKIKSLIRKGADVYADSNEALELSVEKGQLDILKYLLKITDDTYCLYYDKETLLLTSILAGHLHIVKHLIEIGADIHANNNEALCQSAAFGHLDIVKYLIESGADIHVNNDMALRMSSKYGFLEIVKYLVEKGADIHAENDWALKSSAFHGYMEVVKYFIVDCNMEATGPLHYLKEHSDNNTLDAIRIINSIVLDKNLHNNIIKPPSKIKI
jgi:ankyrin repeat protein